MSVPQGNPVATDGAAPDPGDRHRAALRALSWLLVAAALAATFWLYTRPNLLLDLGSFMQMCGFI
jgi:hypothetical protein